MPLSDFIDATVLEAPKSNDLAVFEPVLATLDAGKNDATYIKAAITKCSATASLYCNRKFGLAKYYFAVDVVTAFRSGVLTPGACEPIHLPQTPIVSVLDVSAPSDHGFDLTLVEGVDFRINKETGAIHRISGSGDPMDWWPLRSLRVLAWAGYVLPGQEAPKGIDAPKLPGDVTAAVEQMVRLAYSQKSRPKTPEEADAPAAMTVATASVLDKYRV